MSLARALAVPAIARLWGALALAAVGDELLRVAVIWIAVALVAESASYLSALQAAVLMLGSAVGGRLIDSRDPRGVLVGACLARAAVVLLPVAAWFAGGGMLMALALASAGLAALRAQFDPAVQTSVPRLARDEGALVAANGLLDGTQRLARLVGPGIAGPLAWLIPIEHFFTVVALVLLAAAALLRGLPPMPPVPAPAGASLRGVREAIAFIVRHRLLGTMTAISTWSWGAWVVAIPLGLALVVAERQPSWLGIAGIGAYSFLIAAYGAANILANVLVAMRPARPGMGLVYGGTALLGAGIAAMGAAALWAPESWLLPALALAAFVGAAGSPAHDIRFATEIQTAGPPGAVAPLFRARMVGAWGAVLAAGLVAPALFRWIGVAPAIAVMGVSLVATSAVGWGILRGR